MKQIYKVISIYLLFEVIIDVVSFGYDGFITALILKSTSAYGIVILIDKGIKHEAI